MSNTMGTISFADAGPNTRTTLLFINFKDNSHLDQEGFAPFGTVVGAAGMATAVAIHNPTPSECLRSHQPLEAIQLHRAVEFSASLFGRPLALRLYKGRQPDSLRKQWQRLGQIAIPWHQFHQGGGIERLDPTRLANGLVVAG